MVRGLEIAIVALQTPLSSRIRRADSWLFICETSSVQSNDGVPRLLLIWMYKGTSR